MTGLESMFDDLWVGMFIISLASTLAGLVGLAWLGLNALRK